MDQQTNNFLQVESWPNKSLCSIPNKIRPITDHLCQQARRSNCSKLPCSLFSSSPLENPIIECENLLEKDKNENRNASAKTVQCQSTRTLHSFIDGPPY